MDGSRGRMSLQGLFSQPFSINRLFDFLLAVVNLNYTLFHSPKCHAFFNNIFSNLLSRILEWILENHFHANSEAWPLVHTLIHVVICEIAVKVESFDFDFSNRRVLHNGLSCLQDSSRMSWLGLFSLHCGVIIN